MKITLLIFLMSVFSNAKTLSIGLVVSKDSPDFKSSKGIIIHTFTNYNGEKLTELQSNWSCDGKTHVNTNPLDKKNRISINMWCQKSNYEVVNFSITCGPDDSGRTNEISFWDNFKKQTGNINLTLVCYDKDDDSYKTFANFKSQKKWIEFLSGVQ